MRSKKKKTMGRKASRSKKGKKTSPRIGARAMREEQAIRKEKEEQY